MTDILKNDLDLIADIADRAEAMADAHGVKYKRLTAMMDVQGVHQSCPLKLDELLAADDTNFAHDVFGIANHIDRSVYPGKLTDCFRPRFAA
jgi:hypothetical protein|tara:strand:+ start:1977 stop:2252 length:276 start_codon:yes stop_codon:yes gene_type:complete